MKGNMIATDLQIREAYCPSDLPGWLSVDTLSAFLHENLKPYEDTIEDTRRGVRDALVPESPLQGFVLLAIHEEHLLGALVMLRTGMQGYIPPYLLLFVAVDKSCRGTGIGTALIRAAFDRCDGDVKLHVELNNPALRLYRRLGFANKYAEMRWVHPSRGRPS